MQGLIKETIDLLCWKGRTQHLTGTKNQYNFASAAFCPFLVFVFTKLLKRLSDILAASQCPTKVLMMVSED